MLSQKIKEKLETENVCTCVIISIRDDIEQQEQDYLNALQAVKSLTNERDWLMGQHDKSAAKITRLKSEVKHLEDYLEFIK